MGRLDLYVRPHPAPDFIVGIPLPVGEGTSVRAATLTKEPDALRRPLDQEPIIARVPHDNLR